MDPEYSQQYAELYRSHWWWRAREVFILRNLDALVPTGGWNRILDVGCGDGLTLGILTRFGREVEGLEADPAIVSQATAQRFRIHIGMLDQEFAPEGRFDLITMFDVLEHIQDPVAALQRCREILAPGGSLLITVPAFRSLWTHHDDVNHHFTRYTRRSLTEVLQRAGLSSTMSRYFFHWLVLPKLAIRAHERLFKGRPSVTRIPSPAVNRGLTELCTLEQKTVTRLRIIPGTSLLTLASSIDQGFRS
jgi:2-polyprenyl-3-methyl-5-hydroxy-6-metoxy-1,4-benzoquinol methylase